MNENALTRTPSAAIIENVMVGGDLSKLSDEQRVSYYKSVCDSMGLNPLTQPFAYIKLNGRLTLYAKRDAADQLRKLHGVSIDRPTIDFEDDLVIVSVTGHDKTGRTDSDLGVVSIGNLHGDQKANAILKAITKAKRRLTLSIVGLGWLDETEVDSIPGAQVIEPEQLPEPEPFDVNNPPPFQNWQHLKDLAVQHLGYRHDIHVTNTLKKVFNGDSGKLTHAAAWKALVDHQAAKVAELVTDATELDADDIDVQTVEEVVA